MDDNRRQRLADNERAFRELNEQIADQAEGWEDLDGTTRRLVCECCDPECAERLEVTPAEYRMVRRHDDRFLVARGHVDADIERVIVYGDRFLIIEKHPDLDVGR